MTDITEIKKCVAGKSADAIGIARRIWEYAELPYEESRSCDELVRALEGEGFSVERGIAGMPTAFRATFSNGVNPVRVALLAEYDALDGLSQEAGRAEKAPIASARAGHGCGHNLMAGGCYLAAVALKEIVRRENLLVSVVLFGCPAEEGAGSKQFIARAGLFGDIDFALAWHPASRNEVQSEGNVAIMGANFIFDGVSSHAGEAPHLGRSALDACELMNVGCNYLREHMSEKSRIHYAYGDAGGSAPNVVQDHAVIKYEVRAPKMSQAKELFSRVANVARGAALMTETTVRHEITMAFSDYAPNVAIAKVMDESLRLFGAPEWTDSDYALAREFLLSYPEETLRGIREGLIGELGDAAKADEVLARPLDGEIRPFDPAERNCSAGSTDVGDAAYATPTAVLHIASQPIGNVGHTWQTTALSGSAIGMKAMVRAAEVMAHAALAAAASPEVLGEARRELLLKNGGRYVCPLPDSVTPPIGRY